MRGEYTIDSLILLQLTSLIFCTSASSTRYFSAFENNTTSPEPLATMAVEAAEEEKLPTKSTAANKMDETKKASIEFGIPKVILRCMSSILLILTRRQKRKPRGLLIPGLNTSIEVRTPKYTTITRAASEPVDVQAELQALRKQVEDLQVHQDVKSAIPMTQTALTATVLEGYLRAGVR